MRLPNAIPSRLRHRRIRLGVFVVVAASTSLWGRPMTATAGGLPTLQMQHDRGIAVIEPDRNSRIVLNERHGVASPNGSLIATSRLRSKGGLARSTISVLKAKSGRSLWEASVVGRWRPEAVSVDGSRIILGDPDISSHHTEVPTGRTSTVLMVLDRGQSPRMLTFAGNLVAEAFSRNGAQAVLVEHLPAERPASYRVRPLDLRTGQLLSQTGAVKSANATTTVAAASNLEPTVMQGVRINQSWAAAGNALYTLYDASPYGKTSAMFVHALDLDNVVATCLAVPETIEAGEGNGSVLSVNDKTVVVVGRNGIATIDAKTGATLAIALSERRGRPALALAAAGASLWVASEAGLEQVNVATLESLGRYTIPAGPRGIVPLSYGPVTLLDSSGTVWFVGPGVPEPIKRGRVSLGSKGSVLLAFP